MTYNTYFKTNEPGEQPYRSGSFESSSEKIVALIPRGEVIRNFVYTGALDRVADHADLSLICVTPNEKMSEMLAGKYGDIHELEEIDERWLVRIQREIIEMAHGKWLW